MGSIQTRIGVSDAKIWGGVVNAASVNFVSDYVMVSQSASRMMDVEGSGHDMLDRGPCLG